jgi:hypothetical protein
VVFTSDVTEISLIAPVPIAEIVLVVILFVRISNDDKLACEHLKLL